MNRIYTVFERRRRDSEIYWIGIEKDLNIMVMELLGSSLEDLLH
jgi:hypothetical protein